MRSGGDITQVADTIDPKNEMTFLDDVEHCRARPGLYVNDIGTPYTLVKELIDNAVDEVINSYGNKVSIDITKLKDGEFGYLVQDNCGGIPLYNHSKFNQIVAKLLFTKSFSSGKFNNVRYKYSGGTFGLGLTIVNALSRSVIVQVNDRPNKRIYKLLLSCGKVKEEVFVDYQESPWWSTSIYLEPDPTIFLSTKKQVDLPLLSLKLLSTYYNATVTINNVPVEKFIPLVEIDNEVYDNKYISVEASNSTAKITLFLGWSKTKFNEINRGSVNITPCYEGFHIKETKYAIGKVIASYSDLLVPSDASLGLRSFSSLLTTKPVFAGQAKTRLSWAEDWTDDLQTQLISALKIKLDEIPDYRDFIVSRMVAYKKQMAQLSDTQFINSVIRKGDDKRTSRGVGIGIYDCTSSKRDETELYIVEGPSAAGGLLSKRNRSIQAVLPLRGKPLNVAKTNNIRDILSNKEIRSIVNCVGVGVYPDEDITKCRYGKVIITVDADADGCNIRALLIGAFSYLTPSLITAGILYFAEAPLYKQNSKYYWDDTLLDKTKHFDRFKGLGSMEAAELEEVLLIPANRKLTKVELDDKSYILDIITSAREKKSIMIKNNVLDETMIDISTKLAVKSLKLY